MHYRPVPSNSTPSNEQQPPRPLRIRSITAAAMPLSLMLGLLSCCSAQEPEAGTTDQLLTVSRIFDSKTFEADRISIRWLPDSSGYLRLEASASLPGGQDVVRYDAVSFERTVLVGAKRLCPAGSDTPLAIEDYSFSKDMSLMLVYTNSRRVWRRNTRGDYWLLDRSSGELRQLGGAASPSTLMFAKISPTGEYVAYVRDRNIYIETVRDGRIEKLTTRSSPEIINGTFDWVYEEELGLRDGYRWNPDGKSIAYWQLDTTGMRTFTMIRNTDGLYPKLVEFKYPKVGQQNAACRIGVVSIDRRSTRWLTLPGSPRDNYVARMQWRDSAHLVLQRLNRRQNRNRILLADAQANKVREILVESDAAWVNVHDEMHWLDSGTSFSWVSERDGWRHAYLVSADTGKMSCATAGEADVAAVLHVDGGTGRMLFTASPENASQRFLFTATQGEEWTRLTPQNQSGTHNYQISPNGKLALHSWSSFDRPPVVEIIALPSHRRLRLLTDNERLRKELAKLKRPAMEFLRVPIGNGIELDGWCIRPPSMDVTLSGKYPLLIYVYGEPAGQTVLDRWGGPRQLWHWMLAQRGYVIMSFDNRGTPSLKGREWRKSVYRQVGVLAPREQAAAVRQVLSQRKYLDPKRVGVWGWSGGGSMSLNAIFKYPKLYRTAISVAPVPNQRYYDTIYQERYMGLPQDNVQGFLEGSPINYAHQLEGNLLLVHGTGDDNCHYQTTEMLINELIRHNKPFSMMAYPNRTHAIREGANTTVHLRSLMTRFLERNLPVRD